MQVMGMATVITAVMYILAQLSKSELKPLKKEVGASKHGSLYPGDTIEVHYVHSTAQVKPGPTLGACLR